MRYKLSSIHTQYIVVMWNGLQTICENAIGSHRNTGQCADMIKYSTSIAMALGIVDESANVNTFRCVANTWTNSQRYVVYVGEQCRGIKNEYLIVTNKYIYMRNYCDKM